MGWGIVAKLTLLAWLNRRLGITFCMLKCKYLGRIWKQPMELVFKLFHLKLDCGVNPKVEAGHTCCELLWGGVVSGKPCVNNSF